MTTDEIALGQLLYLEGKYWYVGRITKKGWVKLHAIDGTREWYFVPLDDVCRRGRETAG